MAISFKSRSGAAPLLQGDAGWSSRPKFGEQARGHRQVLAHIDAERVEHLAVLHRRSHLALAQQVREVMQVSAQRREFGTRSAELSQAVGTACRAVHQRWDPSQKTREVRPAGKTGPSSARGQLFRLGACQSE
jgi:ABC-type hemin transport system ATPase subunit